MSSSNLALFFLPRQPLETPWSRQRLRQPSRQRQRLPQLTARRSTPPRGAPTSSQSPSSRCSTPRPRSPSHPDPAATLPQVRTARRATQAPAADPRSLWVDDSLAVAAWPVLRAVVRLLSPHSLPSPRVAPTGLSVVLSGGCQKGPAADDAVRSSSIPILWPLIVPYLIWIFFIDQGPSQGGRANQRIRKSRFWVWFAGYYPVR